MKVEKVMINGKGYYCFRNCENIKDLCARCCFSKGNRCDLPFPCKLKSYYVRPDDCPVRIANTTINMDLPEPPEMDGKRKEQEGNVAAEQKLTERNEKETDKAGKESEGKKQESTEPENKEPESKEAGKASGANVFVADKDGKEFVLTRALKADIVKREGNIGKRSYYAFPNGVEAEDICRYLPFNLGNVVKYVCRAGRKDATKKVEDLEKARDYLENEIKRLEKDDD